MKNKIYSYIETKLSECETKKQLIVDFFDYLQTDPKSRIMTYKKEYYSDLKSFLLFLYSEIGATTFSNEWFKTLYLKIQFKRDEKRLLHSFFVFCVINQLGVDSNFNNQVNCLDLLNSLALSSEKLFELLFKEKALQHYRVLNDMSTDDVRSNVDRIGTIVEFDTTNAFVIDLLVSFNNQLSNQVLRKNYKYFFSCFVTSLDKYEINDIFDFNENTLIKQIKFFRKNNENTLVPLKYFYLFIISLQSKHDRCSSFNGRIDQYYIMRKFAFRDIECGYFLVPFEFTNSVPSFDRWMVTPTGSENLNAIDKSFNYLKVTFENIHDSYLKMVVKKWFLDAGTTSLVQKVRSLDKVIYFIKFIEEIDKLGIRKFVKSKKDRKFFLEEITNFSSAINKMKHCTANTYFVAVRNFLTYCYENNYYDVDMMSLKFLVSTRVYQQTSNIKPICSEDYAKLTNALKENSSKSNLYKLYFNVFKLLSITPLRYSTIVDLKTDCIVERGRKGLYALRVIEKNSKNEHVLYDAYKEIIDIVNDTLELTSEYRNDAPDKLKEYLFLTLNRKFHYSTVHSFSFKEYLMKTCESIGIQKYSAQNIRKKYMTNVNNMAISEGLTPVEIRVLTRHKNPNVTFKHYIENDERKYLEFLYGIEIGDVPIKGAIVQGTNVIKKDVVCSNCGICSFEKCQVIGTVSCLMCNGFITTPDFISSFQKMIRIIDSKMINCSIEHDRTHLLAVKRLHIAYLEQLLIVKKESAHEREINSNLE